MSACAFPRNPTSNFHERLQILKAYKEKV
jgi:hypothetical protein